MPITKLTNSIPLCMFKLNIGKGLLSQPVLLIMRHTLHDSAMDYMYYALVHAAQCM